jgi:Holliday junction resolvase
MAQNAKGSRRERQLLEKLSTEGYLCHRIAGSGVGETAICDLIAIKAGVPHLIEVKSRKKVYYPSAHTGQLSELIKAAHSVGANPMLAVKIDYKDWQFFDLKQGIPAKVC